MTTFILAIIISIITTLVPPVQSAGACVFSDGANIPADLATAQAGSKCLSIAAGVFTISPAGGSWLNETANNLDVHGAGIGKTILQTTGVTLTNNLQLMQLHGAGQRIHDLTIQIGAGYTGPYGVYGISVYDEATGSTIERVEISGGYTSNGSNGAGISTYRTWGHASQFVTVRDVGLHDMPTSAVVVNSSNNAFLNNRIANVGASSLSHGFYDQGGGNLFSGNTVDHASGYSFHLYKQVANIDGSGDRLIGNVSTDPGAGHVVVNGRLNDANPSLPVGAALTRNVIIQGNIFRNTLGHRSLGVWANGVPAVISGNTLEDINITSGAGWIDDNAGSVITGNILSTTGTSPDGPINQNAINVSGVGAIIDGNRITLGSAGGGIRVSGGKHRIVNNVVLVGGASGAALILTGDALFVSGNSAESTGAAYALQFGTVTNILMTQNYLKKAGDLCNANFASSTGRIFGNLYDGVLRYSNAAPGLLQ